MAFATVLFGACMAFGMTLSEFELLKTTSAITVMIIGTAKDLVTIGTSVVIYGDVLDVYNVCGLFLCLMGIIGYNNYKLQKMKKEATNRENRATSTTVCLCRWSFPNHRLQRRARRRHLRQILRDRSTRRKMRY